MLHPQITVQLPAVIALLKKHKIKRAAIFGSATTLAFNDKSDIDFIVSLEDDLEPVEAGEHLWDLNDELKDLFQREVDLLTERSLKNPYFIAQIDQTKHIIYG